MPIIPRLDIGAPIVPAVGLGGFTVGTPIRQISEWLGERVLTGEAACRLVGVFEARYSLASGLVELAVDVRNGKIASITAFEGYMGQLFGIIRPGMLAGDALRLRQRARYCEAEGLILFDGIPGVVIGLSEDDPDPACVDTLQIRAVSVTIASFDTGAVQRGDW